jgi:LysM repeat protein
VLELAAARQDVSKFQSKNHELVAAISTIICGKSESAKSEVATKNDERLELLYHLVLPGEALDDVAKTYQISPAELMRWNNLTGNDLPLKNGRRLLVCKLQ